MTSKAAVGSPQFPKNHPGNPTALVLTFKKKALTAFQPSPELFRRIARGWATKRSECRPDYRVKQSLVNQSILTLSSRLRGVDLFVSCLSMYWEVVKGMG